MNKLICEKMIRLNIISLDSLSIVDLDLNILLIVQCDPFSIIHLVTGSLEIALSPQ
jgi:hypothetical protein